MMLTSEKPKRKINRLIGYDYSQNGYYFITLCIKGRNTILWDVGANCVRLEEKPQISRIGSIIENEINRIPKIYKNVLIDKYVIMPNHVHMIIVLQDNGYGRPQVTPTVSRIIKQFKGSITKIVSNSIWQKSFHDHIIRNEDEYKKVWEYIDENVLKWAEDCYYTPY